MSSIWVEWHSALSTCFPLRTEESIRLEDAIVSLTNWFFFSSSFLRTPSWAENEGTFQANYTIWHHKKKTPIKLFTLYRAITFTHCSFIARSFTHTHLSLCRRTTNAYSSRRRAMAFIVIPFSHFFCVSLFSTGQIHSPHSNLCMTRWQWTQLDGNRYLLLACVQMKKNNALPKTE